MKPTMSHAVNKTQLNELLVVYYEKREKYLENKTASLEDDINTQGQNNDAMRVRIAELEAENNMLKLCASTAAAINEIKANAIEEAIKARFVGSNYIVDDDLLDYAQKLRGD